MRVGPPLYIVVEGLNVSTASPHINAVCGVAGCNPNSLANQVWGMKGRETARWKGGWQNERREGRVKGERAVEMGAWA